MKRAPFFVAVLLIVGVLLPGTSGAATFTTIDVPGATLTVATDINDLGQIVGAFDDATGRHSFLRANGFTTFDPPGTTVGSLANGINDLGEIVGGVTDATGFHGYLRSNGFTTIDVPGATSTEASGINGLGEIVGVFDDAAGPHGFLRSNGFTTIDVPGAIVERIRPVKRRATSDWPTTSTPRSCGSSPPVQRTSAIRATPMSPSSPIRCRHSRSRTGGRLTTSASNAPIARASDRAFVN